MKVAREVGDDLGDQSSKAGMEISSRVSSVNLRRRVLHRSQGSLRRGTFVGASSSDTSFWVLFAALAL